ncbi:M20 family peptidase PepV [Ketogulonicigenium vulgare Y25]|nr:M20 family peptidase PepV [Ketogulonicigenium vulgare Y25]ANW35076.1 peptidase M20 [Ketogulonicigenium vulgare]
MDAWFAAHRDEFIADLIDWVTYPSVSDDTQAAPGAPFGPDVAAVFERVLARAAELGFQTETHDGYAISVLGDPPSGAEEIGLASHLDVVPAGENWTIAPYEAFYRDGFVLGRGASDNKGPALVDLYLLRAFRDLGINLQHRLRVIYGGAEEVGMADLEHYAAHYPVPRLSIISDGGFPVNFAQKGNLIATIDFAAGPQLRGLKAGVAVNAVPATAGLVLAGLDPVTVLAATDRLPADLRSRLSVTAATGGTHLLVRGQSGHAAFPENTLNAITLLARALADSGLLDDPADQAAAVFLAQVLDTPWGDGTGTAIADDETGRLTQNGGIIAPYGDGLRLHIDIRYPVAADHETLLSALTRAASGVGGQVQTVRHAFPVYIERESPLVSLLQSTFNTFAEVDSVPFSMGGGTHARVLPNSITFGPGFGRDRVPVVNGVRTDSRPDFIPPENGFPHGPDEFVSIDNLWRGFRIYAITLIRLDKWLQHG